MRAALLAVLLVLSISTLAIAEDDFFPPPPQPLQLGGDGTKSPPIPSQEISDHFELVVNKFCRSKAAEWINGTVYISRIGLKSCVERYLCRNQFGKCVVPLYAEELFLELANDKFERFMGRCLRYGHKIGDPNRDCPFVEFRSEDEDRIFFSGTTSPDSPVRPSPPPEAQPTFAQCVRQKTILQGSLTREQITNVCPYTVHVLYNLFSGPTFIREVGDRLGPGGTYILNWDTCSPANGCSPRWERKSITRG